MFKQAEYVLTQYSYSTSGCQQDNIVNLSCIFFVQLVNKRVSLKYRILGGTKHLTHFILA